MTTPPDKTPDPISAGKAPEFSNQPTSSGNTASGFESYMQGGAGKSSSAPGQSAGPTPMELTGGAGAVSSSGVSYNSILAQSNQMQDSLGVVKDQLNNKNLKLKRSQNHLVKQKLGDANSHIRAAGSKLGLEMAEGKIPPGVSALGRFIAMVNDGQDQLVQVQQQLQKMSASGVNINPADMLSVEVKIGLANQEIQYTSSLLGKVIQSFTQLLNTQL